MVNGRRIEYKKVIESIAGPTHLASTRFRAPQHTTTVYEWTSISHGRQIRPQYKPKYIVSRPRPCPQRQVSRFVCQTSQSWAQGKEEASGRVDLNNRAHGVVQQTAHNCSVSSIYGRRLLLDEWPQGFD
ncbi:unnamed protein product [Caenorhabditis auriculariae]|uniref:Uncharacterized protein n=1 Tax=Caenorhabditis auriculariae TaxID=2777116 RepID=A0A8S1GZL1_9PELO|nr:unnamed protein product [Caenorhabditis auriculariae]